MGENLREFDIGDISDVKDPHVQVREASGESLANKEAELVYPKCEFLTGGAGTGKTTLIRQRMEEWHSGENGEKNWKRNYGALAATTGIAAINLGANTTTINSLLGFFDTDSLEDAYAKKKLHRALRLVAQKSAHLIIDEVSMMHARQLDCIWDALVEINQLNEIQDLGGLGLVLTGDFCQLPPVPEKDRVTGKNVEAKYAFEAICWKRFFEPNITRLTKVWRQQDPIFIKALTHARKGEGVECASTLVSHPGVTFARDLDMNFDGTTIFARNDDVDAHNGSKLRQLLYSNHKEVIVKSFRWGKQRSEWKQIPEELRLAEGAYVMILANDSKANGFRFANGSTGDVLKYFPTKEEMEREQKGLFEKEEDDVPWAEKKEKNERVQSSEGVRTELRLEINVDEIDLSCMDLGGEDPKVEAKPADTTFDEREVKEEELVGLPGTFNVKLRKPHTPHEIVDIRKVTRQCTQKDHPDGVTPHPVFLSYKEWKKKEQETDDEEHSSAWWHFKYNQFLVELTQLGKPEGKPDVFYDYTEEKWVVGEIYYYPLRLAYASTVHKTQGLTLDNVQIDMANKFFGSASMAYVALSRVRTAEGLRIIGSPTLLEQRCNVSRKVVKWL